MNSGWVTLAFGVATLAAADVLAWWAAALFVAALAWRPVAMEVPSVARTAAALVWIAGLLALGGAGVLGVAPTRAVLGWSLVWLAFPRRWAATGPLDERMTLLLSALMVLLGASTTPAASALLGALGWSVAAPFALASASQRGADARHVGLPVLASLVLALALFFGAPRWSAAPEADPAGSVTGASEQVAHRRAGGPVDDLGVVLRVQTAPSVAAPTYWRGAALSGFDGVRWWSIADATRRAPPGLATPSETSFVVTPERALGVAFTAGEPVAFLDPAEWWVDASGSARRPASMAPYTVFVRGSGDAVPWASAPTTADLDVPRGLRPLLVQLVGDDRGDARETVAAIKRLLADGFVYSRAPRAEGADASLERFLTSERVGHCEEFASAAAALARAAGLPARVVTGWHGSEPGDAPGEWVIRAHRAHAWAEVWTGVSWVLVDATPQGARGIAERRRVGPWVSAGASALSWARAYDRDTQGALLRRPGRWWLALGGIGLGAALLVWFGRSRTLSGVAAKVRARSAPRPLFHDVWGEALRLVAADGLQPPRHLPPLSAAAWVIERDPRWVDLHALALVVYEARYTATGGLESADAARACLDRLRQVADAASGPTG